MTKQVFSFNGKSGEVALKQKKLVVAMTIKNF